MPPAWSTGKRARKAIRWWSQRCEPSSRMTRGEGNFAASSARNFGEPESPILHPHPLPLEALDLRIDVRADDRRGREEVAPHLQRRPVEAADLDHRELIVAQRREHALVVAQVSVPLRRLVR